MPPTKKRQRANEEGERGAPHIVSLHVAKGARLDMRAVDEVIVETGRGIVGDRYHGTRHRHVSVQSIEELDAAASQHGAPIDPGLTRRNVTLSHGPIPRQPGDRWQIGPVRLEVVRDAAPCKLLDDKLGRDVRLSLSKRAGVICRVLEGGAWRIGDRVQETSSDSA